MSLNSPIRGLAFGSNKGPDDGATPPTPPTPPRRRSIFDPPAADTFQQGDQPASTDPPQDQQQAQPPRRPISSIFDTPSAEPPPPKQDLDRRIVGSTQSTAAYNEMASRFSKLNRSWHFRELHQLMALEKKVAAHFATSNQPIRLLAVGVADLQELESNLAIIQKHLPEGQRLEDRVELTMVDLKSRADVNRLDTVPPYAGSTGSTPYSEASNRYRDQYLNKLPDGNYQVPQEVTAFLDKAMQGPTAHFDTNLTDYLKTRQPGDQPFDVILCNHVLSYFDHDQRAPLEAQIRSHAAPDGLTYFEL